MKCSELLDVVQLVRAAARAGGGELQALEERIGARGTSETTGHCCNTPGMDAAGKCAMHMCIRTGERYVRSCTSQRDEEPATLSGTPPSSQVQNGWIGRGGREKQHSRALPPLPLDKTGYSPPRTKRTLRR